MIYENVMEFNWSEYDLLCIPFYIVIFTIQSTFNQRIAFRRFNYILVTGLKKSTCCLLPLFCLKLRLLITALHAPHEYICVACNYGNKWTRINLTIRASDFVVWIFLYRYTNKSCNQHVSSLVSTPRNISKPFDRLPWSSLVTHRTWQSRDLICIREVPSSNLESEISYPRWFYCGFPQFLQSYA